MSEPIEFEVTVPAITNKCEIWTHSGGLSTPTTHAEFDAVARKMGYVKATGTWWTGLHSVLCELQQGNESPLDTLRRIIAERDALKKECAEDDNWQGWSILDEQQIDGACETTLEILKRIIAERDSLKNEAVSRVAVIYGYSEYDVREICKAARANNLDRNIGELSNHTCTIDGVTYRGNEETIGKMLSISGACREFERMSSDHTREINTLKRQLSEAKEEIDARKMLMKEKGDSCAELSGKVADLKEKLAEAKKEASASAIIAKSSTPIHDKWRKAIEVVMRGIDSMYIDAGDEEWSETAAKFIARASKHNDIDDIDYAIACCLHWLAAELEKGQV